MSIFHIALTGHRPNNLAGYLLSHPFYQQLRQILMEIIEDHLQKYDTIICHCGMALGADTIWAEAIANMRHRYPSRVLFVAHIPCLNQESKWSTDAQQHYHELLKHKDDAIIYAKSYTPTCMQKRNIGMINDVDLLIAIWDGSRGGTANCVAAAKKQDISILQIKPSDI